MKKIIFILLFPSIGYGQISISRVSLSSTFVGGGSVVSSQSYNKNGGSLYIVITGTSNAAGTPATASLSGTGQTWTEIGTAGGAVNSTSKKRVQMFRFAPSSLNTNNTSISYTGTVDGSFVEVYEVTGADVTGTNGSNAIVQVASATDNATIQPSITMSALIGNDGVIAGWINDVNPPTGTVESGWTEGTDNGYASPTTGGYIMYRNNTVDNTPSWTAGALSNWAGLAIEIKSSLRRVIITN